MFWKYNFSSSAQIETLLQKEDVTLFELMDEDELLQECKAQNRKLIEFLTRADVLDEMIYLVVSEPSAEGEIQMRFKYANLAAEVLTADVPAIIDKLVASPNLLDILYKFLEREKPLNPLLASFFSKVLGMLVQRRSEQNWYSYQFTCFQVLDFLKSKGDFVDLAVRHVGTSAIMDLLIKLICNVEEDEIRQSVHQWLSDGMLVERLVDKLSPDADVEDHSSADNLLCEISSSCRDVTSDGHQQTNPLLVSLECEDTVNKLLDLLLHEERNDSSLAHVINILLTLLSAKGPPPTQQQIQQQLQQSASLESSDSDSSDGRRNAVARVIAKRLPSLQNILLHPPKKNMLMTAYGQEVEPLGNTRLQVVTLVAALVAANDSIVHTSLYELNTVEYLLDLFFKFMLNNFLHTQVEQCLTAILTKAPPASTLEGDSQHRLLTQLFTEGRIVQRILEAFEESTDKLECKQIHNLKGYMGHLRQLANTIVQQAEFGPNEQRIKDLIQGLPGEQPTQWDDFVSNTLAELNRKNEITPLPGFKEMDMDVIGDFRYADDGFKDPDDNLSGPLQRLTTQALALSGGSGLNSAGMDGGGEAGVGEDHDLFEDMCSSRLQDMNEFDAMWNDKEKEITFNPEPAQTESAKDKEAGSSSDEEDEDEFTALSTRETKMEVDTEGGWPRQDVPQKDWAEVFDKRGSGGAEGDGEKPNPWESAPMSDTSQNSGWADFGASFTSAPQMDGFVPSAATSANEFGGDAFKADFSNVKFDAGFEANCDDKHGVTSTGEAQESFLSSRGLMKVESESGVGSEEAGAPSSPSQATENVSEQQNFSGGDEAPTPAPEQS